MDTRPRPEDPLDPTSSEAARTKIALRGVYKVFGSDPNKAIAALEQGATKADVQARLGNAVGVADVSLDVHEGETFVLMGLSGSGKSTLLRLLNRLHEPTRGSIVIDGTDITTLGKRALLEFRREKFSGMVFQQFAILPHRTVLDNVAYGLEVQGVTPRARQERAQRAIELVGLAGWEQSYPHQLSGGMQQRVGLARALAVDADVLLMDEAFSALDPLIRREMQDELIDLQTRMRKTIVFVTHDLDEALRLGDRIAIMKDARVVQVGTPEEVITEPADDYVAAFVEGVDRSGVLTAASIMQPVREVARLRDGPQTALNKMRRSGLSGIIAVDGERRVLGYLTSERIVDAMRERSVSDRIHAELMEPAPTVAMDTPLSDVIVIASEGSLPVAVVDDGGRLRGVVVKGAILAALARPGSNGGSDDAPATGPGAPLEADRPTTGAEAQGV